MIRDDELGRYECRTDGHSKFWHIVHDVERNVYLATWGKIGKGSPPPKEYTEAEARKKINEKLSPKKGYVKNNNPRYAKVKGSVAVAFILSLEQDGDGEEAA
jgi:hypothetical protein